MRFKHILRGAASAMVLAGFAGAGQALAQEQDEVTTFDELVVTAQKREQRLQDVPIVVTVATEQLLEDAGVSDIRELSILTPGLTVTATSSESSVTARIRGIGTVGDNPGLESSVGVVIDGVYRPRNGVGFGDLGDVARIEVLKGPQGTLFGKNTSAGVISVITKEPSFNSGADIELTGGNFSAFGGSLNLTGPLIDEKLAGSLFVAARGRDGIMTQRSSTAALDGQEVNDQSYYTVRGQLLALPNEQFSARIIADYSQRDEKCCAAAQFYVGRSPSNRGDIVNLINPGSLDVTNTPFDRISYNNRPYFQNMKDMGLSAELNYDLNDSVRITSITAWRNNKVELGSDSDYTDADLIYIPNDGTNNNRFRQLSQEVRLAGERGQLNWLVGAFYADEQLDNQAALNYGTDFYNYLAGALLGNRPATSFGSPPGTIFVPGPARLDKHNQDSETFAVFTNNDYEITDALTATLGLRYTSDKKTLVSDYTTYNESCRRFETAPAAQVAALIPIVGGVCVPFMNGDFDALGNNLQSIDENEVTGTFKLAYRWSPTVMTYASASRGYKASGFNLDRDPATCGAAGTPITAQTPTACPRAGGVSTADRNTTNFVADPDTSFAPEVVESYEIGAKTQWFDNSLLLNLTYFDQTFTDFQLNTFVSPAFVVVTLPEITSTGVDFDFFWNTPISGLNIQGGATFADTVISPYGPEDFPQYSDYVNVAHMQNQRMAFAPKTTYSIAASYETPIMSDSLVFRANVSGKYNSDYNTGSDLAELKQQPAYTLINGRIGIGAPDDKWRIELWGENIFDEDYIQVAFNGPFMVSTNAVPLGTDPATLNAQTSVYNAYLGTPRTFGITLRSKM